MPSQCFPHLVAVSSQAVAATVPVPEATAMEHCHQAQEVLCHRQAACRAACQVQARPGHRACQGAAACRVEGRLALAHQADQAACQAYQADQGSLEEVEIPKR